MATNYQSYLDLLYQQSNIIVHLIYKYIKIFISQIVLLTNY
jgi:hypothetical protein